MLLFQHALYCVRDWLVLCITDVYTLPYCVDTEMSQLLAAAPVANYFGQSGSTAAAQQQQQQQQQQPTDAGTPGYYCYYKCYICLMYNAIICKVRLVLSTMSCAQ
jgi:hypothetical protein